MLKNVMLAAGAWALTGIAGVYISESVNPDFAKSVLDERTEGKDYTAKEKAMIKALGGLCSGTLGGPIMMAIGLSMLSEVK